MDNVITSFEDLENIKLSCEKMIKKRLVVSGVSAFVPGFGMVLDAALLAEIINNINNEFKLTKEDIEKLSTEKSLLVFTIASKIGNTIIGKVVTKNLVIMILKKLGVKVISSNLLRFVPVAGQILSAGINVAMMNQIAKKHIDDCYQISKALLEKDFSKQ